MSKPKAKSDKEMLPFNCRHNIRDWNQSDTTGFALIVMLSLDLVIYKMGGNKGLVALDVEEKSHRVS